MKTLKLTAILPTAVEAQHCLVAQHSIEPHVHAANPNPPSRASSTSIAYTVFTYEWYNSVNTRNNGSDVVKNLLFKDKDNNTGLQQRMTYLLTYISE